MDDARFLSFVIDQNNNILAETNIIFDRSSKAVPIVALLAGVTVFLSSFSYLDDLNIVVGMYYVFMALNAVLLTFASISLACAFKSRGYDVINVKEWNKWRMDYANLFTEEMNYSPDEIAQEVAKELPKTFVSEVCQYAVDNKAVNDRRRWFVDAAISLAIISLFLIIGQALCKLAIEQIMTLT